MTDMSSAETSPAYSRREVDKIIGENIHRLMWRAQENQTQVAPSLGMSQSALSNKLRGKRPWFASEIEALAERYRVTPGSLFKELPHLDSNQEPIGSQPEPLGELVDIRHARRLKGIREADQTPSESATVTPIAGRR
jgi:transcriptional regulator with XRE-family HTH domain